MPPAPALLAPALVASTLAAPALVLTLLTLLGCPGEQGVHEGGRAGSATVSPEVPSGQPSSPPGSTAGVGSGGALPPAPPLPSPSPAQPAPSVVPEVRAGRVVAVGDLHGDLQGTRAVLRIAKLIDERDRWVGGSARLVQLGDVVDRGDQERQVLELLERLEDDAKAAGGSVHLLHGNHELWNVAGNFRYVNPSGFAAFAEYDDGLDAGDADLSVLPKSKRGRRAAFRPGGVWAHKLADHPAVLRLEDTVFVHGGVLPKHAEIGIEAINAKARAFLRDGDRAAYAWLVDWDSPLMSRHYSEEPSAGDCGLLDEALARLGAKRMVVAHIVQHGGIAPACAQKVWRIDAGIAERYGGRHQALEIRGDRVRVLGGLGGRDRGAESTRGTAPRR